MYQINVYNFNKSGELYFVNHERTDKPEEAITMWFENNKKYPTCVDLNCQTKDDAQSLIDYYKSNSEDFLQYFSTKEKWLLFSSYVLNNNLDHFLINGDSVFPFSKG